MTKIVAFAAIALCAVATPTLAADPAPLRGATHAPAGGFYAALRGGLTMGDETQFALVPGAAGSIATDYDADAFVAGAVGIRRGALRGEIEVSYARYGVDTHTAVGDEATGTASFGENNSFGDASAISAMASAYYDFNLGRFTPFVGAGIGIGQLTADGYGVEQLTGMIDGGVVLDDHEVGLAYHATVGVGYQLSSAVGLELAYRYQGIEAELNTIFGAETDVELTSHNVLAGVRIGF